MKKVIFVGWVNQGKAPVDGETTKNQYIIAELKKYCKVTVLDFYKKNRHPWVYVQALWALLTKPQATIIFSTSEKMSMPFFDCSCVCTSDATSSIG